MSTATTPAKPEYLGLLTAGYVMAFVLPIGGIVVAFVLSERRLGHAFAIACLSVISGFAWGFLVLSLLK